MLANQATYDDTAGEFQAKSSERLTRKNHLVERFLEKAAPPGPSKTLDILELGAGPGEVAQMMAEHGHNITAVEFSSAMAALIRQNAPDVTVIAEEFLAHNFETTRYDAIYAVAFIHLFPLEDAREVIQKMHSLLKPGGVMFISTTKHRRTEEGYITKMGFKSLHKRYRRQYTKADFVSQVQAGGFAIINYDEAVDNTEAGKTWMNLYVRRTDGVNTTSIGQSDDKV